MGRKDNATQKKCRAQTSRRGGDWFCASGPTCQLSWLSPRVCPRQMLAAVCGNCHFPQQLVFDIAVTRWWVHVQVWRHHRQRCVARSPRWRTPICTNYKAWLKQPCPCRELLAPPEAMPFPNYEQRGLFHICPGCKNHPIRHFLLWSERH